mgnify:CR=1 FL=1
MAKEENNLESFEGFEMDVDLFEDETSGNGGESGTQETEEEKKAREKKEAEQAKEDDIDFGDPEDEAGKDDEEKESDKETGKGSGQENDDEDDEEETESVKTLKTLKEKGVIDLTDEEMQEEGFDADEALETKWEEALDNHVRESAQNLPENVKDLIRYANKGGDVNEYLKGMYENSTSSVTKDSDMSKDENLKKAITEDLKHQGYDDDYIETHIETLEKNEKLEKLGKKSFEKVIKRQDEKEKERVKSIEEQNRQKKAKSKEDRQKYEQFIQDNTEVSGIKLTPKMKKELPDYIHNASVETEEGKKISPIQRDLFKALKDPAKLTALASVIKNDFDFDGLSKKKAKPQTKQTNTKTKKKAEPRKRPVWDDI